MYSDLPIMAPQIMGEISYKGYNLRLTKTHRICSANKTRDDKVIISAEYYQDDRPSYICSICNQTLIRLTDAGQNNTSFWCQLHRRQAHRLLEKLVLCESHPYLVLLQLFMTISPISFVNLRMYDSLHPH
jgi:hypothetical protein